MGGFWGIARKSIALGFGMLFFGASISQGSDGQSEVDQELSAECLEMQKDLNAFIERIQ